MNDSTLTLVTTGMMLWEAFLNASPDIDLPIYLYSEDFGDFETRDEVARWCAMVNDVYEALDPRGALNITWDGDFIPWVVEQFYQSGSELNLPSDLLERARKEFHK